jgi:hypothetical protein
MEKEEFCGEMERRSGRPESGGRIGWILAAPIAAWALRPILLALVAVIGGCAHTEIARGPDDCGTFTSSDTGVGLIHVPGDQYQKYAYACGAERFSRVVAEHRTAMVRSAYAAAAGGGRDVIAREEIARTQRDVQALAGTVVQLGDVVAETEGGAK